MWKDAVEQIHQAATKTLRKTIPGRKYIDKQTWWWTDEVKQAVKEKKMANKTWWNSRLNTDLHKYGNLKSGAKTAVAAAKDQYYQTLHDQIDTPLGENMYRLAKSHHRSTEDIGHVMHIKEADAKLLRDRQSIPQSWTDYFDNISNKEFTHPPITSPNPIVGPDPSMTPEEVNLAISKMKNGKATVSNDLPAEIWKILGKPASEFLASLFNRIIVEKQLSQAWTTSITVPIWKAKGDVNDCSTYLPIRLLYHT
ncbi:uncharacterized protein LOC126212706 [Schistocerca nitens]|uniref:uncharacterized protein LOC126212706 n=1 Tax=Schistocerca nitens TaxID=7011 RepID=UPI0021193301|nr:uncharacterized protein LOC126212706 [Schistocerca nitens]